MGQERRRYRGEGSWQIMDGVFFRQEVVKCNETGQRHNGISGNQMCSRVICTKNMTCAVYLRQNKPTRLGMNTGITPSRITLSRGENIIHDKVKAHDQLVQQLNLKSIAYDSKSLKLFLYPYRAFNRYKLQGFLEMHSFVSNPPSKLF